MASRSDKMAVTVDQPLKPSARDQSSREELDQKNQGMNQKMTSDVYMLKKKSTFKITSITKNSRGGSGEVSIPEADVDLLDELDETAESHTEDPSSETLDNSKYDDVTDQYSPLEDSVVPESDLSASRENKEKSDGLSTRFKVVKIETKEPFRRGRWTCRDSFNTPVAEKSDTKLSDDKERNSGNSSACSSVNYVEGVDDPSKNPLGALASLHLSDQANQEVQVDKSHVQPIPGMMISSQQTNTTVVQLPNHIPEGSFNIQPNPTNASFSQVPIVGLKEVNLPKSLGLPAQLQQQLQLMNHLSNSNISGLVPSTQGQSFAANSALHMSNTVSVQGQQNFPIQQGHGGPVMSVSTHDATVNPSITNTMHPTPEPIDQSKSGVASAFSEPPNSHLQLNSITVTSSNSDDSVTNLVMSDRGGKPPTALTTQVTVETEKLGVSISQSAQSVTSPLENSDQKSVETVPSHSLTSSSQPDPGVKEQISSETVDKDSPKHPQPELPVSSQGATPLLTPSAVAEAVGGIASPATETDESGSSTVAIDNKIEQAMDLVKSHLMYAVREEIEDLKEQIKQLIEKNNQLEYENSILKSAASPETLTKLTQPLPPQQPPSSSS